MRIKFIPWKCEKLLGLTIFSPCHTNKFITNFAHFFLFSFHSLLLHQTVKRVYCWESLKWTFTWYFFYMTDQMQQQTINECVEDITLLYPAAECVHTFFFSRAFHSLVSVCPLKIYYCCMISCTIFNSVSTNWIIIYKRISVRHIPDNKNVKLLVYLTPFLCHSYCAYSVDQLSKYHGREHFPSSVKHSLFFTHSSIQYQHCEVKMKYDILDWNFEKRMIRIKYFAPNNVESQFSSI